MGNPMPIAGVILSNTGERLNFVQAVEQNVMKWGFARSLQEAQASNGFIIDPIDGQTYSVDEAVEKQLVKKNHSDILRRAEKGATIGYDVKDWTECWNFYQSLQIYGLVRSPLKLNVAFLFVRFFIFCPLDIWLTRKISSIHLEGGERRS